MFKKKLVLFHLSFYFLSNSKLEELLTIFFFPVVEVCKCLSAYLPQRIEEKHFLFYCNFILSFIISLNGCFFPFFLKIPNYYFHFNHF